MSIDGTRVVAGLRHLVIVLLLVFAYGAEAAPSDDDLVKTCTDELRDRLFAGGAHGEVFIVGKDVQRQDARTLVHLDLASGEGRKIAGTCIFRDGKLFDVKQ